MADTNHYQEPTDGSGTAPVDEAELASELEECLAILVRALFVNAIDPSWPQDRRWFAYVNFPDLPWNPRPDDLPVEIPDPTPASEGEAGGVPGVGNGPP